tara:strand:- start:222 stop:479 length:258 start_codon:yes stop_codon:yes gene_type:complete
MTDIMVFGSGGDLLLTTVITTSRPFSSATSLLTLRQLSSIAMPSAFFTWLSANMLARSLRTTKRTSLPSSNTSKSLSSLDTNSCI